MKEEKGKILLQPSFKQQQQTQQIKINKLNNNMTNKHEQQQKRRTSTMAGLTISTNFSRLQKGQQTKKKKKKSNINIFNTPSNLKKK